MTNIQTTTITDVIAALLNGKSVTRTSWPSGFHFKLSTTDKNIIMYLQNGEEATIPSISFNTEDFKATDWIIFN